MNIKKIKFDRKKLNNFGIKTKTLFMGNSWKTGLIHKIIVYYLLILFGFIYLYPFIKMIAYSFMSLSDVVNPTIVFIPTSLYLKNFVIAFNVLNFFEALGNSFLIAFLCAACQSISTSLIGYGLGKFTFPGKKIVFVLVILTFIIPPQITMIPQVIMYSKLKLDNILSLVFPSILGQGIKSAIFIFIFYSYFYSMPKSLQEAAKIDGANPIKNFILIACPLATSAYILTFIFSFVWYYNETALVSLFLGIDFKTLPLQLQSFKSSFEQMAINQGNDLNEAVYMAGTLLSILPLLIIYFIVQRFLVDSIEKAGLTAE